MTVGGYNPMRWNCDEKGCYNEKLRPRIEEFAQCFPGKIGMSDIDGVVEISGRFLFLEWKAEGGSLSTGQRIMFERLTRLSRKITVIVVCGHPRDMVIETVQIFHDGKCGEREQSDFAGLLARVTAWAQRCKAAA